MNSPNHPEGSSNMVEREAIARIVSPSPFAGWQSMYDYCLRQGDDDETARWYADGTHKPDCDAALEKADAILALVHPIQPVGEPEGWRDIASAPKDGTWLVGYGKPSARNPEGAYVTRWAAYGEGSPAHAAWKRGEGPEGTFWHYEPVSNWTNGWVPTHWMPLPSPPTNDEGRSRG